MSESLVMASQHRIKRVKEYTRKASLSKLKSYVKRKSIDLKTLRLEDNDTLLHLACSTSKPRLSLVKYLLRRGIDPLFVNESGDTALHIACNHQSSERGSRSDKKKKINNRKRRESDSSNIDVILKLIKACPNSLDVPNYLDVTPRVMLKTCREQLHDTFRRSVSTDYEISDEETNKNNVDIQNRESKANESNAENVIYVTDDSSDLDDSEDEKAWNKKLSEAMFDEYEDDESWRSDTFDSQKDISESYDDWANRISTERARKCNLSQNRLSGKHYKSRNEQPRVSSSSSSIPKISEEKRRKFERKMAEGVAQHRAAIESRRCITLTAAKMKYERQWDTILSKSNESTVLQYRDIPWPHPDNSEGVSEVGSFLFCGMIPGTGEYQAYLRRQRVRWHPDRFCQRCSGRLEEGVEKDKIINKVTEISKVLNALCRVN